MKKFIQGSFEIDKNVTDTDLFVKKNKSYIDNLFAWADKFGVEMTLGTSDDNTCLCEYKIVGNTVSMCKGILSELKSMLKTEFPKTKSLWQGSGDVLW